MKELAKSSCLVVALLGVWIVVGCKPGDDTTTEEAGPAAPESPVASPEPPPTAVTTPPEAKPIPDPAVQEDKPPAEPPQVQTTEATPETPPQPPAVVEVIETAVERAEFSGLTVMIPTAWEAQAIRPMTLGVYQLPTVGDDAEICELTISHFPIQKGQDDENLNRWYNQVVRSDSQPWTRETAQFQIKDEQALGIKVTLVDLSGTVARRSMDSRPPMENGRMLAAIIDHEQGPHFIVLKGSAASVGPLKDAFIKLIDSARVQ